MRAAACRSVSRATLAICLAFVCAGTGFGASDKYAAGYQEITLGSSVSEMKAVMGGEPTEAITQSVTLGVHLVKYTYCEGSWLTSKACYQFLFIQEPFGGTTRLVHKRAGPSNN